MSRILEGTIQGPIDYDPTEGSERLVFHIDSSTESSDLDRAKLVATNKSATAMASTIRAGMHLKLSVVRRPKLASDDPDYEILSPENLPTLVPIRSIDLVADVVTTIYAEGCDSPLNVENLVSSGHGVHLGDNPNRETWPPMNLSWGYTTEWPQGKPLYAVAVDGDATLNLGAFQVIE